MSRSSREPLLAGLADEFGRRRVVATVLTGLVLAMVNTLLTVALMSLIFKGALAEHLHLGIGIGLMSSAAISLIMGLGSGVAGLYAGVQDASAAILGLVAASVVAVLATGSALDTVLAMLIISSLATGFVILVMARFGIGEIVRFVPFPVVGGLLAGTGYLIVAGSIDILGGIDRETISGAGAALFWPGVILAAAFLISSRTGLSSRVYLLLLAASVAGFHLILAVSQLDRADARGMGLLLGPFSGSLWPGPTLGSLAGADWSVILAEAPSLITILLIVPVTVLLYLSAIEVDTMTDLDVGRELRVTGWANIASGLLGGPPGYHYLADTLVTRRLVGGRRGPVVVLALILGAIAVAGGFVIELLPQFVVGGLLLFVGFDFLLEWLWDTRRKMSRLDYLLMVGIVLTIALVGFLPGVLAGLVAAIVLFVVRYSKIDVVKHELTAGEYRSNVERSVEQAQYLADHGGTVLILTLQGFIFFGTASRISSQIHRRLDDETPLTSVICDFRLVSGIDSSALVLMERIALVVEEHGARLIISGVPAKLDDQVRNALGDRRVGFEVDLDHAVASCEEALLGAASGLERAVRGLPEELTRSLDGHLETRFLSQGAHLMRQGDPAPGLYMLVSGRASIILEPEGAAPVRLRTLLEGTLIGEMSLYTGKPVGASVVADTDCELLHLSLESFQLLCTVDPAVAADLHAFVARTLAARIGHANRTIEVLQK